MQASFLVPVVTDWLNDVIGGHESLDAAYRSGQYRYRAVRSNGAPPHAPALLPSPLPSPPASPRQRCQ